MVLAECGEAQGEFKPTRLSGVLDCMSVKADGVVLCSLLLSMLTHLIVLLPLFSPFQLPVCFYLYFFLVFSSPAA